MVGIYVEVYIWGLALKKSGLRSELVRTDKKIQVFFLGTPITVELYCDVIIEANQYLRSKPSVS